MYGMFSGATVFNQDLSKWDVSKVTNMPQMFYQATAFNQDLSKWDVSKVTSMRYMFERATAFNQDLSKWDVSKVTSMSAIFYHATAFNQDLSEWDVSNVTNMYGMFERARAFNQDLSKWDVSKVTDMNSMFSGATAFNQDLLKWDVSSVTTMRYMFNRATAFNQDLSKWDVSRVVDMYKMFTSTKSFDQTLCGAAWVNSKADKGNMFSGSSGKISAVNVDRHDNDKVVENIGAISQSNGAYQCDKQYEEITSPAPLSPHSNILRVCIEGESAAFQCEKIVSATLKQAGNADTKLITDGTLSAKYTKQSSKGQTCMLTTLVLPKYFAKKSADHKLSLTLEGSALMPLASRRRLRRLDAKAPGDKNFELTVEVLPAGETQSVLGSHGTVSGVCNVVISALIAISMVM